MSRKSPGKHELHKDTRQQSMMTITVSEKLQIISPLKQILLSCFGPRGRAKYIQNRHGALMTVSSSSAKILANLTFVSPISQLASSSILQHLAAFSDNGLFMGILMLSLIEGALKNNIHHKLCCEINILLMNECLDTMQNASHKLEFCNMTVMVCLVHSIFKSKCLCDLSAAECDYLSSLVLQILMSALPDNKSKNMMLPHVEYVTIGGHSVSETKLINGVLLEVPKRFHRLLSSWNAKRDNIHTPIKVALFNTSLALDKTCTEGLSVEVSADVDVEKFAVQQMERLASRLEQAGVNFIGCQKVIHPSLMKMLNQRGILCVDRLSIVHIGAVQRLTGASLLSSMNCDIPADTLGRLSYVTSCQVINQRMLHMIAIDNSVTTVILCHRTEACLKELKHVFGVAYHISCLAINHPEVIPGCGYIEDKLTAAIHNKIDEMSESACSMLHCSREQFRQAADVFLGSLDLISKSLQTGKESVIQTLEETDLHEEGNGGLHASHLKERMSRLGLDATSDLQPEGGSGKCDDKYGLDHDILDLLVVKKNAFQMAVEVANMILSIGCMISSSDK